MATTKTFYRIIYAENLNFANEDFKTIEEAWKRNEERPNDGGIVFRITEFSQRVKSNKP